MCSLRLFFFPRSFCWISQLLDPHIFPDPDPGSRNLWIRIFFSGSWHVADPSCIRILSIMFKTKDCGIKGFCKKTWTRIQKQPRYGEINSHRSNFTSYASRIKYLECLMFLRIFTISNLRTALYIVLYSLYTDEFARSWHCTMTGYLTGLKNDRSTDLTI